MPTITATVSCPVHDSFRVQQVAGMFDVPLAEKVAERFQVELPDEGGDWQLGLIVGPSGSGKSTVAREAYGDRLFGGATWPHDRAVVDAFDGVPVRTVIDLFTAVGFGSPPSWIKPYHVLSGGERFRCDLARALSNAKFGMRSAESPDVSSDDSAFRIPHSALPLVVFDEFTSVVDRTVAKVCSAAIAKGIRRGTIPCRFVAVTCHYDVAQWLAPDWVLDMATGRLQRRCLRRPTIELEVRRCRMAAWQLFKRHHYLSGSLANGARCYLTTWEGEPVNFCATMPLVTKKRRRRFTRIVTLPDYQGIGIGMRAMAAVAALERRHGYRVNVTSSHPALIRHCRHSPLWRCADVKPRGTRRSKLEGELQYRNSVGRAVVSFEFIGRPAASPTTCRSPEPVSKPVP
jgi:GNAT superfamily N-acetyltransferase